MKAIAVACAGALLMCAGAQSAMADRSARARLAVAGGTWRVVGTAYNGRKWDGTLTLTDLGGGQYSGVFRWISPDKAGVERLQGAYDLRKGRIRFTDSRASDATQRTWYLATLSPTGDLSLVKWAREYEWTRPAPGVENTDWLALPSSRDIATVKFVATRTGL